MWAGVVVGEVAAPARTLLGQSGGRAQRRSLRTMTHRLAVVGGGNMGAALVGGLLRAGWAAADIAVVEVSADRRTALGEMFPGVSIVDAVPSCEAALIAVKPYDVASACSVAVAAGARRLLSIAAGISLAALQSAAGPGVAVVRSAPPAIAAHLCNGVALEQLGTAIEAERLLPGMVPLARPLSPDTPEAGYEAGVLCDVLWVDRFGACQLNLGPDDLPSWAIGLGSRFLMRTVESGVGPTESSVVRTVERVPHAGTLGTGSIGLADDPYGMVALVLERRSAAEELGLNAGDQLVLEPLDADDTGGPSVPVTLRPSR
jgi:hypothetical protein